MTLRYNLFRSSELDHRYNKLVKFPIENFCIFGVLVLPL